MSGPAMVAPVWIDGQAAGDAWIFPAEGRSKVRVSLESLAALLNGILTDQSLGEIRRLETADGVVTLAELDRIGLRADFDDKLLQLKIEIPNSMRRPHQIDFAPKRTGSLIGPSEFSGYLNLRGSVSRAYGSDPSTDWPFLGSSDFAINNKGLVFQGGYEYFGDSREEGRWRRADTRLTYDWPDRLLRGSFGELDTQVRGFQAPLNLAGLSVVSNYQLQPYNNARARTRTQVEIKRPSTVDVILNGVRFTRLRAAPGILNLARLPLVTGNNRIRLIITDDLGEVQTIDLDYLFDPTLVAEGQSEFGYHLGYPWKTIQTGDLIERAYKTDRPTVSLFHRYGLTSGLTLAGNLQADNDQNLFEFAPVFATNLGLMEVDFAHSFQAASGSDWATRLRYRSTEYVDGRPKKYLLRAGVEYRGARFSPVSDDDVLSLIDSPYSWQADLQLQKRLAFDLTAGIGVSHSFRRGDRDDRQTYYADLSWSVRDHLQMGLNLNRVEDTRNEEGVLLTLTWQDEGCCASGIGRFDSLNQSVRADIERRSPDNFGFSAQGSWEHRPAADTGSLAGFYRGYRGELGLRHDSLFTPQADGGYIDQQEATLSAGTALVWTRNAFALSRPVTDSFAIFPVEGESPNGAEYEINRSASGSYARTDRWGPGVIADAVAYYDRPVSIEASRLPVGVQLKRDNVTIKPSYRSGVEVPIEVQSFLAVRGSLLDESGQALGLVSGEVREAATNRYVGTFFTNRSGRFLIEGMKAGTYRLDFFGDQWRPVTIEVPNGKVGTYPLEKPLRVQKE